LKQKKINEKRNVHSDINEINNKIKEYNNRGIFRRIMDTITETTSDIYNLTKDKIKLEEKYFSISAKDLNEIIRLIEIIDIEKLKRFHKVRFMKKQNDEIEILEYSDDTLNNKLKINDIKKSIEISLKIIDDYREPK